MRSPIGGQIQQSTSPFSLSFWPFLLLVKSHYSLQLLTVQAPTNPSTSIAAAAMKRPPVTPSNSLSLEVSPLYPIALKLAMPRMMR